MRAMGVLTCAGLVAAACLGSTGAATAGMPSGGGGTVPPGTIFFKVDGASLWSMQGDGGAKTQLTAGQSQGFTDRASRLLHGGKRWFLRSEVLPGEAGVGGGPRRDLFAVRQDGALSVRLTSDATVDYFAHPTWDWCPNETANGVTIAGTARRWTGTSTGDTVLAGSAGIYAAHLSFDASGNVLGLSAEPSFLLSIGTVTRPEGEVADARTVSWSPDMSRVACDRLVLASKTDIRVIEVMTGAATVIVTAAYVESPAWAPNGSKIVYHRGDTPSAARVIETATPDGAVRTTLATASSSSLDFLGWPHFSPDSASVVFTWVHTVKKQQATDVGRVSASGGTIVNLTDTVAGRAAPIDWR